MEIYKGANYEAIDVGASEGAKLPGAELMF